MLPDKLFTVIHYQLCYGHVSVKACEALRFYLCTLVILSLRKRRWLTILYVTPRLLLGPNIDRHGTGLNCRDSPEIPLHSSLLYLAVAKIQTLLYKRKRHRKSYTRSRSR